ncbi:MAG: hypothetical protein GY913_02570 [Proteobacteria bacterium]|nr:hypothetical protein [Pseudomonadota bacterium]MCP4915782.1 hypothetical protein [Pseudomonadota bacterium]
MDTSSEVEIHASDAQKSDYFGYVLDAGDFDGDGTGDLLVGAHGTDKPASGAGAAYTFLGTSTGFDTTSEERLQA